MACLWDAQGRLRCGSSSGSTRAPASASGREGFSAAGPGDPAVGAALVMQGHCLGLGPSGPAVQMQKCDGRPGQRWQKKVVHDDGRFQAVNTAVGLCLDVDKNKDIVVDRCDESRATQHWHESAVFQQEGSMCVDLDQDPTPAEGQRFKLFSCHGLKNQRLGWGA